MISRMYWAGSGRWEEEGARGDYLDWHDDERGGAEEDEAAGRGQAGRHDPEPVSRQLPVVDM